MRFIIRGKEYDLTYNDIQKSVNCIQPKGQSKYTVEINGDHYPIKQIIENVTGLPPLAFTTAYAYRILDKLGYKIDVEK